MQKVPYMDLAVKDQKLKRELMEAVEQVFSHGRFILGPEVEKLEKQIAEICNVKYAIGVASGTDALYLALRALNVGPGDEVITTCLSFIATANAISLTGATPRFVDIDTDFNIDTKKIEREINKNTKVILPVHYAGKICNMPEILSIAQKNGLEVVEDAAQAFGASRCNKSSGSFGRISCFSMNSMKILASCGEAGVVVTEDENLCDTVKALRYNGMINKIEAKYRALNGRIDTLQAAILLVKLRYIKQFIARRREIAVSYNENLKELVQIPNEDENCFEVWYSYNIICEKRNELQKFLADNGIETKICFPLLMPQQPAYKDESNGNFPVGEKFVNSSLSLPLHEDFTDDEMFYVISKVEEFYKN